MARQAGGSNMAAEWAVALTKVAGPIFGKLAVAGWQRMSLSWLVAWQVIREAKKAGLPVPPFKAFRRYLSGDEPLSSLSSGDPNRFELLASGLTSLRLGDSSWALTDEQAKQFVALLLSAFTRRLATNQAIEVQGSATRAAVVEGLADLNAAVNVSPEAAFEADLRFLAPLRAKQARRLTSEWPPIRRFTREFISAKDRRGALLDWFKNRPGWFGEINSGVLLWMAELASDYGLIVEAIALINEALEHGATPAIYWRIRRDLLEPAHSNTAQQELLQQYEGQHPIADAILMAGKGSPGRATEILGNWEPDDGSARALKTAILCQLLAANEDIDGSVRVARDALRDEQITGPAQLAAEYLFQRGMPRESVLHFADLETSLELALEVRNAIRNWQGPSHHAVAIAMKAAQALGNSPLAWTLSQPPPAGEASAEESRNTKIRNLAIVISAEIGPEERTRQLIAGADDSLVLRESKALLAQRRDDGESELAAWLQASELATTASDQFRVGFQIAMHGTVPPRLELLTEADAVAASELKLIASVFAGVPGQLEVLRTRTRQSRPLTVALYTYLANRSEFTQAAKVAAAGAEQWSDAELWHIASRAHLQAGDPDAAVASARSALRVARPQWGKHDNVYILLIEVLSAEGRWSEAADAAAELMSRDPHNESAAWALIVCQVRLGQFDEAWRTYSDFGGKPSPRDEQEAVLRVELWRRYQEPETSLNELLEVLDSWNTSQRVRAAVTNALLFTAGSVAEAVSEQIRTRLEQLLPTLEDIFVPHKVDLDNPLKALDQIVAQTPDTSDVDRQVEEGLLPFGMAASIHHRSYLELLASRTGAVFAGDAARFDLEVAAARLARAGETVVDVTALLTLSFFETDLGDQLLGHAGDGLAPVEQLLDSIQSVEKLSHRSTMSVGKSAEGTAQLYAISEEQAEEYFERATRVHMRFQNLKQVSRPPKTNLPEALGGEEVFVWLTALDLALNDPRTPLWCDDAKIRELAAGIGVASFGTAALIESMRQDQILGERLATALQSILINRHYVGLDFRRDWMEAAAALDGWRAGGCASFIARGPTTEHPESRVSFVLDALGRSVDDPGSIRGWVEAMSRWLIRVGGGDAQSNLVWFLQRLLGQSWLTSTQLPFVLGGIRAAAAPANLADPFEAALINHYQGLTEKAGAALASLFVQGLVRQTNEDDRLMTNRMILTT